MKKEVFTLLVANTNENNTSLKLDSTFGDKSVTFTVRDKDGKSCATTLAPIDLHKVVDFLNGRLNAVEESSSTYGPSYTPTGVGLCVFDYQGKLLDTYYNHKSLAQGIEGYSYEQLTEAFGGDKAIYVLFTLYDGSVGRETLVRVMQACVQLQGRFIVTGEPTYCSPMTLDDVAQKAGLDLTTVSRCAREDSKKRKEKSEKEVGVRIYGPRKTFTLDNKVNTLDRPSLFDEGITRDGFPVSRLEVLERIQSMINKENKHKPLGDQDITDELKTLGYDIERRTVAKYRGELLGLPNSNQRRQNN